MKRKAVIFAMAAMLAVTSLTGCGSMKGNETAITVGDDKITADVANFYARYTQAQYETYYGAYLGEDMWNSEAEEGKTYEEAVKTAVQEELEEMVLMEQHMKDYDVSFSDAEKEMIKKSAAKFNKDNDAKDMESVSGNKETVERALELMAVKLKMTDAIGADADENVSDKEAAQKKMDYAFFAYSVTDEEGNETPFTDEEKADLKKEAEAIAKDVKGGKDLEKLAKKKSVSMNTITFDAEKDTLEAEFAEKAFKLKKGDVEVIETETGCYVAKITSDMDASATIQKKVDIIQQRKDELVAKTCEEWKKDAKIDVNEKVWEKMDFNRLRVKMKIEQEQPYADSPKTDDQAE